MRRFSATVRLGKMPRPSGMLQTPARVRASVGAPSAIFLPKSRTWITSHTRMTSSTSCSTSRMARPSWASSSNRSPNASVSWVSRPEPGSSRSSRRGLAARARASSTSRARPVGMASTRSLAAPVMPTRSRIASVTSLGFDPSLAQRRRISAATSTFSRAVREPNTSRRWKVRARPSRARWWALRLETSLSSISTLPDVGSCNPVMTLNRVVLPAPLGPMSPVTRPGSAVRSTSCRAMTPPKRTLTSSTDRSDNASHLLLCDVNVLDARVRRRRASAEPVDGPTDLTDDAVRTAGDRHGPQTGKEEREAVDMDDFAEDVQAGPEQHAPEEGAGHREDPADGHHQQDDEALQVKEVVGPDASAELAEEDATDAGHGRRKCEHADLGARQVQAEGGARRRAVLHGRQQSPKRASAYGEDEGGHQHEDHGEEHRVGHLSVEGDAEKTEAVQVLATTAAEDLQEDEVVGEHREGERRQRQVQAGETQRRPRDHGAHDPGGHGGGQD